MNIAHSNPPLTDESTRNGTGDLTAATSGTLAAPPFASAAAVARRFYATVDGIGAGRLPLDALDDVTTEDFVAYLPAQNPVDRAGFKQVVDAFATGFPAATHRVGDVLENGSVAAVRMTWRGNHTGPFNGSAPTGRTIEMDETGFLNVRDGRVAVLRPLFDSATLLARISPEPMPSSWAYEYRRLADADPQAIWTLWSDIAASPRWNPGIAAIEVDGPLAPRRRITMWLPDNPDPIELTIVDVEPGRSFVDEAVVGDLVIRTTHRVEPSEHGGAVVVYRTDITGPDAVTTGSALGQAITADFPDVVDRLLTLAGPAERPEVS